jgi:hypothetical protein
MDNLIISGKSADGSDAKIFEGVFTDGEIWGPKPILKIDKELTNILDHINAKRSIRDEYDLILNKKSTLKSFQRKLIVEIIEKQKEFYYSVVSTNFEDTTKYCLTLTDNHKQAFEYHELDTPTNIKNLAINNSLGLIFYKMVEPNLFLIKNDIILSNLYEEPLKIVSIISPGKYYYCQTVNPSILLVNKIIRVNFNSIVGKIIESSDKSLTLEPNIHPIPEEFFQKLKSDKNICNKLKDSYQIPIE